MSGTGVQELERNEKALIQLIAQAMLINRKYDLLVWFDQSETIFKVLAPKRGDATINKLRRAMDAIRVLVHVGYELYADGVDQKLDALIAQNATNTGECPHDQQH